MKLNKLIFSRFFNISNANILRNKEPHSDQVLHNGPDWSYLDGRPTPLNSGQYKRKLSQIELTKQIIKLNNEIDTTIEMHAEKVQRVKNEREYVMSKKLEPKGNK